MEADHIMTALRPEDFRHAWPTALSQMLKLHADSMDRTEAALAQSTRLGREMKDTVELNLRIATAFGQALQRCTTDPHGLVATIHSATSNQVEVNVLALQERLDSMMGEMSRHLIEQAERAAGLVDQAAHWATLDTDQIVGNHTHSLNAVVTQLQAQCQGLKQERQRLAAQHQALQKIKTDAWWRRLLWIARGDRIPALSKART